jgi:(2Fe-2S) ferredoxin/SAM-dependent methyltransferase
MEPFQYHVYVCNQVKPEGIPCCSAHGAGKIIDRLRREVAKQGLADRVQITTSGSIGLCDRGPNMIVYPDGIWYSGVTPDDVSEIVSEHFGSGKPVKRLVNSDSAALREEIETNKNKMMGALKARDAAGVLPDELLEKVRAFQAGRVILSSVELDLFTAVGQGASAEDIAQNLGLDARATEMLLNALTALGLLDKKDSRFLNTVESTRYLMEDSPNDSRASLMHTVHQWNRWSTLTDCVKEGTSVTYEEPTEREDEWTEAFIAAMHKSASLRAPQVARAIDLNGVKRFLDIGGGSGAYSIAFAQANPELHAEIFDLPSVVPIAQKHIETADLSDRISTRAGDFRKDAIGSGYDLILVSAICHMNSPEENLDLVQKIFKALNQGGRIVIQDFILDPDKTKPLSGALFSLNMLVSTRSGASYSEGEYTDWLKAVGFRDTKLIRLPGPTALLVASH